MKKVIIRSAVLGGIVLAVAVGLLVSVDYALPQFGGTIHTETQWSLRSPEAESSEPVELPTILTYENDGAYILSTTLTYAPEAVESPHAFVSMHHMFFRVLLDGKEIYRYLLEDVPGYSKSPGNAYATVPLPHDCEGKLFEIEFWPTLESSLTYDLGNVLFGDYPTMLHNTFTKDLAQNAVVVCVLFTGLVLIVLSFVMLESEAQRDAWHIGLFAIAFGVYSLSENLFNLYMLSNPFLAYLVNFLVFASIPIPLLLFFRDRAAPGFRPFYRVVLALAGLNVGGQTLLHFLHVLDLRQMLLATHLVFAASFILMLWSAVGTPVRLSPHKKLLLISLLPIVAGLAIDAVLHYFVRAWNSQNTLFLMLGVLVFLLMHSGAVVRTILYTYRQNIQNELYKLMAFQDGLTGLFNRAAYNREIERLEDGDVGELFCVCADINNLKRINDTYGHSAGDRAICVTASFLKQYLGEYGKVFRTGGDEFVALLHGITEERLYQQIDTMARQLDEYNRTRSYAINFSVGVQKAEGLDRASIEACLRDADRKMYACKP